LLPIYPTAKRKGLKRYPFARFGLPGKRYREPPVPRKARSGRRPDAPNKNCVFSNLNWSLQGKNHLIGNFWGFMHEAQQAARQNAGNLLYLLI
jgi:hypothetical protein